MDAVTAPDGGRVLVFFRPAPERGQQLVEIVQQHVGGTRQLNGQGRVQHVRTGHPLVHEASIVSDVLGHPGQECDDIVLGDGFDRVDGLDVDDGIGCPPIP